MIIFIAFLLISTPSFECLPTRTVQGTLFIGFFHLQLFEESTMIIFIVSNILKHIHVLRAKNTGLNLHRFGPIRIGPQFGVFVPVILHCVVGEKEDWINTKESVSFAIPSCLEPPSSKTSVLLCFASHPFIVETDNCDYK